MTTKLKIEKGVPIPPKTRGGKGYVLVLHKMEIGDSVVFPIPVGLASRNASATLGAGNFTCRTVEGGTRVWRLK